MKAMQGVIQRTIQKSAQRAMQKSAQRSVHRGRERGSASMLVLVMAGLLVTVTLALVLCAGLVRAHRMAQSAADLAALAGARAVGGGSDGCAEAGSVAEANGASLAACEVSGDVVRVTTTVPGPRCPGVDVDLRGEARAGRISG